MQVVIVCYVVILWTNMYLNKENNVLLDDKIVDLVEFLAGYFSDWQETLHERRLHYCITYLQMPVIYSGRLLMLKFNRNCPRCEQRMERIRRTPFQHFISKVIPVINVNCCGKSYMVLSTRKNKIESLKTTNILVEKLFQSNQVK